MSKSSNLEMRKIPSLDFLYEISEDGRILRNVKSKKQCNIILDMHHSKVGYYAAFVNYKGKRKRVMIHIAVAECWLGPKPEGLEVDHIDRNTHNNHYTNLRYVTHSEQMKNRVLGKRIIEQATKNCYNYTMTKVAKHVEINGNGENLCFMSLTQCANYLARIYKKKPEHMRAKLKKRRSRIYDYDIKYI